MTRKYKLNLKQALFITLVAAAGFSGCKKYLDINQNPNNPDTAEPVITFAHHTGSYQPGNWQFLPGVWQYMGPSIGPKSPGRVTIQGY